jgi:hypothetical protein
MIFVETRVFSRRRRGHLEEEQVRALQSHLLENPHVGAGITGTGALRKLRWSTEGRGNRGGVRVIYVVVEARELILSLLLSRMTPPFEESDHHWVRFRGSPQPHPRLRHLTMVLDRTRQASPRCSPFRARGAQRQVGRRP